MEYYTWVLTFHIMAMMSWMAILFYLPRLFVYHVENIDKKELEKSTFEKSDSTNPISKYDEKDYERVLNRFKSSDMETRNHEQLHASLGTTTTPIRYDYQMGPDGKLYAIGGNVRFDTSIPKDKDEAIQKLDELQKASSSPEGLSRADSSIAQAANLNKMLIQSIQEGANYENRQ